MAARRGGLHSLGRIRPLSTRPQPAHRMTLIAPLRPIRSVPSPTLAFSRAGSNVERDGKGGVEALAVSDKVASVTRRRSLRNRACRRRFEATPFGVRDHSRLRRRLCARRRSPAQPRQHAPTAAHDPQNACTSPQTTHRPNRPSNAPRLLHGAAGHAGRSRPRFHSACAFSDAHATKARVLRPGPSSSPTRAFYLGGAPERDDEARASAAPAPDHRGSARHPGSPPSSTAVPNFPVSPRPPLLGRCTVSALGYVAPATTTTWLRRSISESIALPRHTSATTQSSSTPPTTMTNARDHACGTSSDLRGPWPASTSRLGANR